MRILKRVFKKLNKLLQHEERFDNSNLQKPPVGVKVRHKLSGLMGEIIPSNAKSIWVKTSKGISKYYMWSVFWEEYIVLEKDPEEKVVEVNFG